MNNDKPWQFQKGHKPWNKGTGGCKRGHDPSRYKAGPSGIKVCLDCKRENAAKYRAKHKGRLAWEKRVQPYGITVKELDDIFNRQRGMCPICGYLFTDADYDIDHDHDTGDVRGLLCRSCNAGLGLLKESAYILERAKKYLNDFNERLSSKAEAAAPRTEEIYRIIIQEESN